MRIHRAYLNSERMRRLSVDIDRHQMKANPFIALKTYYALKDMFPNSAVAMLKTNHGHHVKVVGQEIANLPIEKRVDIREALCDDSQRIQHDRQKIATGLTSWIDTLFKLKVYPDGTKSYEEEISPIALPSISRLPASKP